MPAENLQWFSMVLGIKTIKTGFLPRSLKTPGTYTSAFPVPTALATPSSPQGKLFLPQGLCTYCFWNTLPLSLTMNVTPPHYSDLSSNDIPATRSLTTLSKTSALHLQLRHYANILITLLCFHSIVTI